MNYIPDRFSVVNVSGANQLSSLSTACSKTQWNSSFHLQTPKQVILFSLQMTFSSAQRPNSREYIIFYFSVQDYLKHVYQISMPLIYWGVCAMPRVQYWLLKTNRTEKTFTTLLAPLTVLSIKSHEKKANKQISHMVDIHWLQISLSKLFCFDVKAINSL